MVDIWWVWFVVLVGASVATLWNGAAWICNLRRIYSDEVSDAWERDGILFGRFLISGMAVVAAAILMGGGY